MEAHEVGLVHRVIPGAELLTEATSCARRLARRAPQSVAAAKRAVLEASARPLADGLAEERKFFLASVSQPAAQRAMRAYAERVRAAGPPFTDEEEIARWREGAAVDLVG
jgi:enoyl-CoA hydratase/carnithine racemase